jgi:hypothetical protein
MKFPHQVTGSRLWERLNPNPEYRQSLWDIRSAAELIGRQIERLLPEFTDHSVRHMDALWGVADQILTPEETSRLSGGEALLLAGCFYIHDLAGVSHCDDEKAAI